MKSLGTKANYAGSSHKIAYLDGWRGIAVIFVLYSHFLVIGNTNWLGSLGVDFFFALSGYLMAEVLFIKRQSLDKFFIRRASRIIPVFTIYIVIAVLVYRYFSTRTYVVPLDEIFSTLLFFRSYSPSIPSIWETPWAIGHLWSLNIEEHSYLWLALCALISRKHSNKFVMFLLICSLALTFVFRIVHQIGFLPSPSDFTLYSHVAAYGIFFSVLCRLVTEWGSSLSLSKNVNAYISLGCLCLAFLVSTPTVGKPVLAPFFLAVSLAKFSTVPQSIKYFFSNPILCWFGRVSFSLYVWQQIFYMNFENKIIGLFCSLAVAACSYYIIERPVRKFINRHYG